MSTATAPAPGTRVELVVPASSANLGPGFDSVGLALGVHDRTVVTVTDEPGVSIDVEGEGADGVPRDERHLVHRAMVAAWRWMGVAAPAGVHLSCHNSVPHGRGMGSSATAIVTGVSAAVALVAAQGADPGPLDLDLGLVNDIACDLEGHPDNASASVFGGATLSWSDDDPAGDPARPRTRTVAIDLHPDVEPVVFVPSVVLSTATARSVLPAEVPLSVAAANGGRVGLLVHALAQDPSLLLPATLDRLHQEPRRPSYPASMVLVDELRSAGVAATISGAGPTVLALTTPDRADTVAGSVPAGGPWRVLRPGVPTVGVRATSG